VRVRERERRERRENAAESVNERVWVASMQGERGSKGTHLYIKRERERVCVCERERLCERE
jgi:hypothetical protein